MKEIGILTKEGILEACRQAQLTIMPFDLANLQPTSYDIAVGAFAQDDSFTSFDCLDVLPSHFASFLTVELVELPLDMVGHIYLRSSLARKGLGGIQLGRIEAGWRGKLVLEVSNAGDTPISIKRGDRIATVEFSRLARPVSEGYRGRFQGFGL